MKTAKRISRIPYTQEGFKELKVKYNTLYASRKDAVKTLADARELGDLSENGLYKAARAKLSSIDSNLFRLEMLIKFADVTKLNNDDFVGIGSIVNLKNGNIKKTYKIVGKFEIDPLNNKISNESPLGRSLIGQKIGNSISIKTENGTFTYEITGVNNRE